MGANELRRIWLEVLARAIEEATGRFEHASGGGQTPERIRRDAIEWLMRDPDFVEISTWAGFEAEYLRRKLDQRLRAARQQREARRKL